MSEVLLQLDLDDLSLLVSGLTMLMNSEEHRECCGELATAYLDLLLQMHDDLSVEALQDSIKQELVRKYGEA